MRPKISILVPCYNLAPYIQDCLKSIERQDNNSVEYIFVNDGSSDSTGKIIYNFCKKYEFCILIDKRNGGVSSARNAALAKASGEYIYLLDGDDILVDGAIQKILEVTSDSRPDVILSSVTIKNNKLLSKRELNIPNGDYDIESFFRSIKYFPTTPKLIYKRSIIYENNILFKKDLKFGEVFDFTIEILNRAKEIRVINTSLFYYIIRQDSATNNIKVDPDISIVNTLEEYVKNQYKLGKYSSYWTTAFQMFMTFCYKKYLKSKNNKEVLEHMKKVFDNKECIFVLKKVILGRDVPVKQRMLAIYIYYTQIRGFRFIKRLFQFIKEKK